MKKGGNFVSVFEYKHSEFSIHPPLRLVFNGHDRGKWIYFAARGENNRCVKDTWTGITGAIVH
jgi:hypothetical protein